MKPILFNLNEYPKPNSFSLFARDLMSKNKVIREAQKFFVLSGFGHCMRTIHSAAEPSRAASTCPF
jgi:hypothetical protein